MQLLVVNYHYFRENKPISGIYPLSLKEFERQLDAIYKHYDFISESDLIDILRYKKKPKKNYCLLTFDDGLKEQMEVFELLVKKGIPGMFYVSTGPIRSQTVLNVHKLHFIRSTVPDKHIFDVLDHEYCISNYKFNDSFLEEQYRYDGTLSRKVKYFLNFELDDYERDKMIDFLFAELVCDENVFSKNLYMSLDNIKKLSKYAMLGTHCESHKPLVRLNEYEVKNDIMSSIKFLESVGGNKIRSISYPYGSKSAVNEKVSDISKACGLDYGLTMWRGFNTFQNISNPFLLKRIDTNDAPGGKLNSKLYI
jgi:peptidoglycan/xylan/chitin deacetylase (PgdA/CDA1 family)